MSEQQEVFYPTIAEHALYPPLMTVSLDTQHSAMYAVLTDKERENIRQIVAEEVAKVFPIPQVKPEGVLPECPDCHGWELSGHDPLTPLDTQYRRWWCVCPDKVAAWEQKCKEDLDRLMEAIHNPDSEIEAILVEMSSSEFEGLIEKVRARRNV